MNTYERRYSIDKPCPKCRQPMEEVAPTSVYTHLVPDNVIVREWWCDWCKASRFAEEEVEQS